MFDVFPHLTLLEVLIKTVKLNSALSPWRWSLKGLQKIFQNHFAIRLEKKMPAQRVKIK